MYGSTNLTLWQTALSNQNIPQGYSMPRAGSANFSSVNQFGHNFLLIDKENLNNLVSKSTSNESLIIFLISVKSVKNGIINFYNYEENILPGSINSLSLNKLQIFYCGSTNNLQFSASGLEGSYKININRIFGKGELQFQNMNKPIRLDKTSSEMQIIIKNENKKFNAVSDSKKGFAFWLFYEKLPGNFLEEVWAGERTKLLYDDMSKRDFPLLYYIPLAYINMDITINFRLLDVSYKDWFTQQDENTIEAYIVNYEKLSSNINNNQTNKRPSDFISSLNSKPDYVGEFDNSIRAGRITIPFKTIDGYRNYTANLCALVVINSIKPFTVDNKYSLLAQLSVLPENMLLWNLTLPQNHYFYSLIDSTVYKDNSADNSKRFELGHIYKLSRETGDKFMTIELATCSGDVEFTIRDINPGQEYDYAINPKYLINTTVHTSTYYNQYGKLIIELEFKDYKDVAIVIYTRLENYDLDCTGNFCKVNKQVGYAIRYRTFNERVDFARLGVFQDNLVKTQQMENGEITQMSWGAIESIKTQENKFRLPAYYYIRYFEDHYPEIQKYNSICFAHGALKVERFLFTGDRDTVQFYVKDYPDVPLVISIIGETNSFDDSNTLIAYTPIVITPIPKGLPIWITSKFLFLYN